MVFDGIARRWCALDGDARVVIIADEAREALARELAGELPGRCRVERYDGSGAQMERLRALDARRGLQLAPDNPWQVGLRRSRRHCEEAAAHPAHTPPGANKADAGSGLPCSG